MNMFLQYSQSNARNIGLLWIIVYIYNKNKDHDTSVQ
jgi:hypothetical protein